MRGIKFNFVLSVFPTAHRGARSMARFSPTSETSSYRARPLAPTPSSRSTRVVTHPFAIHCFQWKEIILAHFLSLAHIATHPVPTAQGIEDARRARNWFHRHVPLRVSVCVCEVNFPNFLPPCVSFSLLWVEHFTPCLGTPTPGWREATSPSVGNRQERNRTRQAPGGFAVWVRGCDADQAGVVGLWMG